MMMMMFIGTEICVCRSQKRVDAENAKSYVNDEREQEQSLMLSRLSSLRASLLATFHKSQDESRAKEQKAEHALQAKIETLKHKAIVLDLQKEGLEHEVTKLEAGQQDKPREAPATQTNPVLNQDEANRAHTVKKKQVAIRQASFHDPASKTRSEGKTEVANKATATALSLNEAAIAACDHLGSALLHGGHKISALCKDEAMHIASRKQQQAARRSGLSVEKNKSPTIGRSEHSTKLRLLHKVLRAYAATHSARARPSTQNCPDVRACSTRKGYCANPP
jgi:outer membrane biosynthesis protein TonB